MPEEKEIGGVLCSEVLAELSRYLDGALTDARTAQLQQHLEGCEHCSRFGTRFSAALGHFKERLGPSGEGTVALDAEVSERLAARLASLTEES